MNAALGAITNEAVADERVMAFNTGDGYSVIIKYTGVTADGVLAANEIQLMGVVDAVIVEGDFQFT
jgi:hypothetical protein